jgi:hypothetical protein
MASARSLGLVDSSRPQPRGQKVGESLFRDVLALSHRDHSYPKRIRIVVSGTWLFPLVTMDGVDQ